jgi:hypothetical protein
MVQPARPLKGTFPDFKHTPAHLSEGGYIPLITVFICGYLVFPELPAGSWQAKHQTPCMTVPETPLNKYGGTILGEDDIRFARKVFAVDTKPEASAEQTLSQQDFRLRIFPFDSRHVAAAGSGIVNVSHRQTASVPRPSFLIRASSTRGFIILATARNTGTATELPNCL